MRAKSNLVFAALTGAEGTGVRWKVGQYNGRKKEEEREEDEVLDKSFIIHFSGLHPSRADMVNEESWTNSALMQQRQSYVVDKKFRETRESEKRSAADDSGVLLLCSAFAIFSGGAGGRL